MRNDKDDIEGAATMERIAQIKAFQYFVIVVAITLSVGGLIGYLLP